MDYHQIEIKVTPLDPFRDLLSYRLAEAGFDMFEETEEGLKAYCPVKEFSSDVVDELFNECRELGATITADSALIPWKNWNEEWEKQFFDPITVDDTVHIRAPFHPEGPKTRYCITIEPRMSFGTGHHRTTQMMISLMLQQSELFKQAETLDMGCGTGVLGILAEKMGATRVHGIDNEPWAVENAMDNAATNQCKVFEAQYGDATLLKPMDNGCFDIVLANIHLNVLMTDGKAYLRVLKPGGMLFVSGFYGQDLPLLNQYFEGMGATLISNTQLDEWCAAVFRK